MSNTNPTPRTLPVHPNLLRALRKGRIPLTVGWTSEEGVPRAAIWRLQGSESDLIAALDFAGPKRDGNVFVFPVGAVSPLRITKALGRVTLLLTHARDANRIEDSWTYQGFLDAFTPFGQDQLAWASDSEYSLDYRSGWKAAQALRTSASTLDAHAVDAWIREVTWAGDILAIAAPTTSSPAVDVPLPHCPWCRIKGVVAHADTLAPASPTLLCSACAKTAREDAAAYDAAERRAATQDFWG